MARLQDTLCLAEMRVPRGSPCHVGKLPKTPAFDGLPEAVLDLKGWHKHHWPYQSLSLP